MNISKHDSLDGTVSVCIENMDEGEYRRFLRILVNQAEGTHYSGPKTNDFAQQVVNAL